MDYQLIPLAHEHLGQAAEIERLCFSDPWSEKMLAEHLANPCSLTLAAVGDTGRLLGYVGLLAVVDEGYITNVAVRPDCAARGWRRLCWTPWRPREKSGSWPSSPWRSASPTPPPGPSTRSWDTSKRAFGETTMKIPGRTPSS